MITEIELKTFKKEAGRFSDGEAHSHLTSFQLTLKTETNVKLIMDSTFFPTSDPKKLVATIELMVGALKDEIKNGSI